MLNHDNGTAARPRPSLTEKTKDCCGAEVNESNSMPDGNPLSMVACLVVPALVLFLIGIFAPSVVVNEFGNARSLSLIGGIHVLWESGHVFLAVVIFLFTILFPPAKAALTLAIGIPSLPLTSLKRCRFRKVVEHLGRWSLLDVVVIAVLIVTIKVQGFVSVDAAWGIYAFTFSIFLSMLATHFVKNVSLNPSMFSSYPGIELCPSQFDRNRRSKALALLGFVLLVCGAGWFVLAPVRSVERVQVTRKETFIELPRLFGNPSFYIQVRTVEGPQRLDTKPGTPIGNGLVWPLKQRVPLANVYEVELLEDHFLADKLVDRVTINGRHAVGQRFHFELKGRMDWQRPVAILVSGAGLLMLLMSGCSYRRERSRTPSSAETDGMISSRFALSEAEEEQKLAGEHSIPVAQLQQK